MRTIHVQNFGEGMASDIYGGRSGEFGLTKHFDVLTYPNRLSPFRGTIASSTGTGLGNIIINSTDGLMYGVGIDYGGTPANGQLLQRGGIYPTPWQPVPTNAQLVGVAVSYPFLVDWRDCGHARNLHWAGASVLTCSDPTGASGVSNHGLTFTSIGQGFVHPADKNLYIPYNTSTNCLIAVCLANASPYGGINATALTLPKQYTAYCLTNYGNYLAIPLTTTDATGVNSSLVSLWDRDTSLATVSENINWGNGSLQVLNNLEGVLIGISVTSNLNNLSTQNYDSLTIRGYAGGTPFVIKEININNLTTVTTSPVSIKINPNVNFIRKNRLYFSVDIVAGDSVQESLHGLWSVGKNAQGRYCVTIERMATNDGSETSVLAAAIIGDDVDTVHTAVGTITTSIISSSATTAFTGTSIYESVVNPEMPEVDIPLQKQLVAIAVHTAPLFGAAQVVMKYRVDSTSSWVTCFTKTATSPDTNLVAYESTIQTGGEFTAGRNIEFRLESTKGAQIVGYTYKYEIVETNL